MRGSRFGKGPPFLQKMSSGLKTAGSQWRRSTVSWLPNLPLLFFKTLKKVFLFVKNKLKTMFYFSQGYKG